MLKKLAALLLLVGLLLPYSCDARPIVALWKPASLNDVLTISIPVLGALVYILHTLVPAVARFHERYAAALLVILLVACVLVAGAFLYSALVSDRDEWIFLIAGVVVSGVLLAWGWRRAAGVGRLTLVVLALIGIAEVSFFTSGLDTGDLKIGGWLVTAGYVLAVALEIAATSAARRNGTPPGAPA